MGLRSAMQRWRARDGRVEPDAHEGAFELPPARPIGVTDDDPVVDGHDPGADAVDGASAGSLVIGGAGRTSPTPDLPGFYVPPRPFDDPALLAEHTPSADYDPSAVREAWALVSDRADELVVTFYAELFVRLPEAPLMFPASMTEQRQDFGRALVQWVAADDPEALVGHLQQLGDDHRKFDVEPRHYEVAGGALASAWKSLAGDAWTDRHEAAVLGSYARLAATMLDGAMAHRHEPARWGARVIAHHRVLPDFAVVRVQPDQPYAYKAGQYLTLELASHRKQWRQMSIASAPSPDNCFDLHVRAIGGLGVSAALVNHTSVGDRLSLGPPRGRDLIVEPGMVGAGLLCIASGTGAAPITAVVESVLGWPEPPPAIDVFVGARTGKDLYGVDTINRIIRDLRAEQRAHAYPVVADDRDFVGARGNVEAVVPPLRDWAGLGVDVLIAGPDAMIEATVANLISRRVPRERIHFDQYEAA